MSRSIHTTIKHLKGLTKTEIDEQVIEPNSDLNQLSKKSLLKETVKQKRKENFSNQDKLNFKLK